MKKIFLLFGFAAFCSASAQQKDVFDIQKHLDNMIKDKKIPGAIFKPLQKGDKFSDARFHHTFGQLSYSLSNGDKVYILSQDNMPCVVPGYKYVIMPNISDPDKYFVSPLFRNDTPGAIPNVVKPYRVIVSK